jgi:pimeloyl-ACP methyl ester carboxylesterase
MDTGHLLYKSSKISYTLFGNGPRLLFCFHGYGESAASFAMLESPLGATFTMIAVDLPFHGNTSWKEDLFFAPRDLLSLLEQIAEDLPGKSEGWWLMGYSMGGRVALELAQWIPDKLRWLVLLAPDGLVVNPWYWLATRTLAGNHLFRWTMKEPGWLFFLLRAARTLRLANPSVSKFAHHYIDDVRARQELYARWTVMRGFAPDLRRVSSVIRAGRIPVHLLYGRHDRIIRWQRGESFGRLCSPYSQLTILPAGHQLLQPKFTEVIVSALYLPTI